MRSWSFLEVEAVAELAPSIQKDLLAFIRGDGR
jgi:hypothetical protein